MRIVILLFAFLYTIHTQAQLRNHNDSVSYAAGINMVENLRKAGIIELNENILLDAI